ncbi:CPBP family intramembrane glutamic endopeptidase [Companilactobacillus mishanensis]|uniref:CPBP family intramembrane glutamic endopeptidase n=1 Tax=Companilactobacillus mishanensis TaxID=2486008 RepID=UPI0012952E4E|nr:CPBP family intramembrane glutamic endopeptidase [Companilactobacillus mishanensis]MQS89715.1 CPBP family intramembrane metalloprotease [Companilactobacillus mishanensis]
MLKKYWSIVLFTVGMFFLAALVNILLEIVSGVAHIPEVYGSYIQYIIIMILYVYINRKWIHQEIYFQSKVPLKEQIPAWIFIVGDLIYLFTTNSGFKMYVTGIGYSIGSAVTEEYFIRGIVLIALLHLAKNKGVWGTLLAIFISSVLFGAMHIITMLVNHLGWGEVITAFSMGMVYAALYIATGTILWPMFIHLVQDLVVYLLPHSSFTMPTVWYFVVCLLITLIILIPYFRRENKQVFYS